MIKLLSFVKNFVVRLKVLHQLNWMTHAILYCFNSGGFSFYLFMYSVWHQNL